jgi:hypothetical protein
MSNSPLSEAERNTLVDLVHRRGGDELLAAEVLQWAESVRTSADQLELVLRGFLAPTMRDNGELALVPLHCAVPASSPALEFAAPAFEGGTSCAASSEATPGGSTNDTDPPGTRSARSIACEFEDCGAMPGDPCRDDGKELPLSQVHFTRFLRAGGTF